MEATKLLFNRGMDKQTVRHPYNVILFSDKKEQAIDSDNKMDIS